MQGFLKNGIYPFLLIIGIWGLFHNVDQNGFSGLDDILMIEENWDNLHHVSHIQTAFTEDVFNAAEGSYYRPIQILSYMPDAWLTQSESPNPKVFFQINLILYILAFLLLFFFLTEFNFKAGYRFGFTALMALHPSLTPAVSWIPGRVDTVLFLIVIGSIWAVIRYIKTNNKLWLFLHTFLFTLGMFTKETTIVVPIVTLLIAQFYIQPSRASWTWKKALDIQYQISSLQFYWNWLKSNLFLPVGWIGSVIIWYILRQYALPDNPLGIMSTLYQLSSCWKEFIILGGVTYFPVNLQVFLEITWPFVGFAIPGFVLFLVIPNLIKSKFNYVFLGLAWMFLFILPTTLSDYLNYHRMFIPLVGMVFVLHPLQNTNGKPILKYTIIGCFAVLFLWQNLQFQKAFTDRIQFWNNAVTYSPNSAFANNGLAWSFHLDHKNDSALTYYQRVIDIRPDRENVRIGMALIYEESGNRNKADSLMQDEFTTTKDSSQVYFYIGQVLLERGDTNEALDNLTLGRPATKFSRNARLYYDSLDIQLKNKLEY